MVTRVSTALNLNIIDRVVKEVYRQNIELGHAKWIEKEALCHIIVVGRRHSSRYIPLSIHIGPLNHTTTQIGAIRSLWFLAIRFHDRFALHTYFHQ